MSTLHIDEADTPDLKQWLMKRLEDMYEDLKYLITISNANDIISTDQMQIQMSLQTT